MLMFDFGMLQSLAARGVTPSGSGAADEVEAARKSLRSHIVWWPRVFALLGPLGVAWALFSARTSLNDWIVWMAGCSVSVGVVMLIFMIFRRRLLQAPARLRGRIPRSASTPPIQPIFVASAVRNRNVVPAKRNSEDELDPSGLRAFGIAAVLLSLVGLGLFLTANWYPEGLIAMTSSPSLIFMIAASWMPLVLILVFISHWRAFPAFAACLVAGAIINAFLPDNHAVKLIPGGSRATLDDAVKRWKTANEGDKRPIIVATAGGGIRAAYWTATVLGALQDCTGNLDKKIFAISGVSGGSVGAATYVAQLRTGSPECTGEAGGKLQSYRQCGQAVLSHNLLSAPLVAYAYKDVLLNITRLNAVFDLEDRATASERALQAAWTTHFDKDSAGFTQPFLVNGDGEGDQTWRPALVFNSTSSLTGRRVVVSTLDFDKEKTERGEAPIELHDMIDPSAARSDISLGTAAFLSARFPVISPAGSVVTADDSTGKTILHTRLVDGGYYENFGADTAEDIFFMLHKADVNLEPIVLQNISDPGLGTGTDPESGRLASGLDSVGAPLWAVLRTRDARGRHSAVALAREARRQARGYPAYFTLSLWEPPIAQTEGAAPLPGPAPSRAAPLGWMLSKASQSGLNDALSLPSNLSDLRALAQLIAPEADIEACKASWAATTR